MTAINRGSETIMTNIFDYYDSNTYLAHHGIKGQRWGIRRSPEELGHKIPRSTIRTAKKDAKEFARAKMYYGEGAGNRRKLIKATVNERSKDPDYKREFEKALAKQNMAEHAAKARTERNVKNAANTTAKAARGVVNMALGNVGRASAAAAALYVAGRFAHQSGLDKAVASYAKDTFQNAANWVADQRNLRDVFR